MNNFEKWLIKRRYFCDIGLCPHLATRVVKDKGKDLAVCDAHYKAYTPIETGYRQKQKNLKYGH